MDNFIELMTASSKAYDCTAPGESAAKRSVIVAHPGTQHSYQTALALQEVELLDRYLTGVYYNPNTWFARVVENLPDMLRSQLRRELLRRHLPSLNVARVQTHPLAEMLFVGCSRMKPLRRISHNVLRWRNERFDQWTADVIKSRGNGAVVCYNTCAIRTFEQAKVMGSLRILDQTIADYRTGVRILQEEAEAHPEFSDSIDIALMEPFLERSSAEPDAADLILAGSEYVRASLMENGVSGEKIAVVHYGADSECFSPGVKLRDGVFRILFVGQVSQRKGIKYLLEAVKQLRLPKTELTVVGGVVGTGVGLLPYRESFRWISNVPHHEVHRLFQSADVFVYPSLLEGSAIAIFEALACGLPVVTTANSGSVVRDGMDGFIVPIRDIEALKEKILVLYRDRELREMMSRAAWERGRQFTWRSYRNHLGAVLRSHIERASFG
jgi:alpha-maltose-1-phosphate synthase